MFRQLTTEDAFRSSEIIVNPEDFTISTQVLIKDTGSDETNSVINVAMSLGDVTHDAPYFYLNTWPHVDIAKFRALPHGANWYETDRTGARFTSEHFSGESNQEVLIEEEVATQEVDVVIRPIGLVTKTVAAVVPPTMTLNPL